MNAITEVVGVLFLLFTLLRIAWLAGRAR